MKKLLKSFLIITLLGLFTYAIATSASYYFIDGNIQELGENENLGAPGLSYSRAILPEVDSKYYLGTTTPSNQAWLGIISDEFCLTGDSCIASWPTGSGGTGSASGAVATSTEGYFAYYETDGNTVTGTSSIFILPTGEIGIGTTTPPSNLTVDGDVFIGASGVRQGLLEVNLTNDYPAYSQAIKMVANRSGLGTQYGFNGTSIGANTTNVGVYAYASGATNNLGLQVASGYSYMQDRLGLLDSSPEYMLEIASTSATGYLGVTSSADGDIFVINNSGYVGIATATPAYPLDVYGNARITDTLKIGAYTLPTADGALNGYILKTDGNGTLSWQEDSVTGGEITFYFNDTDSDITDYKKIQSFPNEGTETIVTGTSSSGSYGLIGSYISTTSDLTINNLAGGVWHFHEWAKVDNVAGATYIVENFYARDTGGTERFLYQATSTELTTDGTNRLVFEYTFASSTFSSERLVIKKYCYTTGVAERTCSFYYDGLTRYSHIISPIARADLGYAKTSVNETITGNWTFNEDITGNIDTATALASNPTDCGAGEVAISIDAEGDLTCTATSSWDTTIAKLTEEEVEDFAGGMMGGTETLITVTYQDASNDIDFVVNNDLSAYDNGSSGFITATLTEEEVEDYIGGMLTGNTETNITVEYQDDDGTIDFVANAGTTINFLSDINNVSTTTLENGYILKWNATASEWQSTSTLNTFKYEKPLPRPDKLLLTCLK